MNYFYSTITLAFTFVELEKIRDVDIMPGVQVLGELFLENLGEIGVG